MAKTPLQRALFYATEANWKIAERCGISETRLSRIASGRLVPTTKEKRALARVLRVSARTLFPVESAASNATDSNAEPRK